jgi:hypothetical protein
MLGDDGGFRVCKTMGAGDVNRSVSASSGLHSVPKIPGSRFKIQAILTGLGSAQGCRLMLHPQASCVLEWEFLVVQQGIKAVPARKDLTSGGVAKVCFRADRGEFGTFSF